MPQLRLQNRTGRRVTDGEPVRIFPTDINAFIVANPTEFGIFGTVSGTIATGQVGYINIINTIGWSNIIGIPDDIVYSDDLSGYQPLDADLTRLADYRRIGGDANYTAFAENGHQTMEGEATVWDDIRITPGSFDRPGASDPAFVLYYPNAGGLGTYLPEFAKNNIASFTIQLPHSYKEGESIYVHTHWTPGDRGVTENGNKVGWKVDYSWANIDGAFPDMQTASLSDACDGTNHKHQMTPEVEISGTGKTISSMLVCNIRRSDTGADDTWAGTISGQLPLLTEVDFHFPINSIGSNTVSDK